MQLRIQPHPSVLELIGIVNILYGDLAVFKETECLDLTIEEQFAEQVVVCSSQ